MTETRRDDDGRAIREPAIGGTEARVRREVAEVWGWFLALGIALVVAGFFAILYPVLTTLAANIAIGAMLLAVGAIQVVQAFGTRGADGAGWPLLTGVLYIAAGVVLAFFPLAGILTLTVMIAGMLIAVGVLELVWAFQVRGRGLWGWMLLNGIAALVAGLVIAFALPASALWVLGTLVGLNFLLSGARFIAIGLAARRVA